MTRRTNRALWIAVIAGTLAAGSIALADDLWVKSESVEIRSGMGAMFPSVATAHKGDKLTVLDQQGNWYHVQLGTASGYVFASAISPKEIGADSGLVSGGGVNTGMSTAAAGKGLEPNADNYAAAKNLDPKPLDDLIAWNNKISPEEWQAFAQAGKVGPYKAP